MSTLEFSEGQDGSDKRWHALDSGGLKFCPYSDPEKQSIAAGKEYWTNLELENGESQAMISFLNLRDSNEGYSTHDEDNYFTEEDNFKNKLRLSIEDVKIPQEPVCNLIIRIQQLNLKQNLNKIKFEIGLIDGIKFDQKSYQIQSQIDELRAIINDRVDVGNKQGSKLPFVGGIWDFNFDNSTTYEQKIYQYRAYLFFYFEREKQLEKYNNRPKKQR